MNQYQGKSSVRQFVGKKRSSFEEPSEGRSPSGPGQTIKQALQSRREKNSPKETVARLHTSGRTTPRSPVGGGSSRRYATRVGHEALAPFRTVTTSLWLHPSCARSNHQARPVRGASTSSRLRIRLSPDFEQFADTFPFGGRVRQSRADRRGLQSAFHAGGRYKRTVTLTPGIGPPSPTVPDGHPTEDCYSRRGASCKLPRCLPPRSEAPLSRGFNLSRRTAPYSGQLPPEVLPF